MSLYLVTVSEFFDLMGSVLPILFILALAIIFIYEYDALRKEKG